MSAWYAGPRHFAFTDVVKQISGFCVIPLSPVSDEKDQQLLDIIRRAANGAMTEASAMGLLAARVNEAGERMESFVRRALVAEGLCAETPRTVGGRVATRGYPDISAIDPWGRVTYIEIKVVTDSSLGQTQRAFYLSVPQSAKDCKITADARHVLLSFRVVEDARQDARGFIPVAWSLRDLSTLVLEVKYEFNTCNRQLYEGNVATASAGPFIRQPSLPDLSEYGIDTEEQ